MRAVATFLTSALLFVGVDADCALHDGQCAASQGQGLLQLSQKTSKDIKVSDNPTKQILSVVQDEPRLVLPAKNGSMRRSLPSNRRVLLLESRQTAGVPASMQEVFDAHNNYRCMHGVPLFTWDDAIAAQAQAWADAGNWGHGSKAERNLTGYGVLGENIAWGAPTRTGLDSVMSWYNEISDSANGGAPTSCEDWAPGSEGAALCHYTQVVWRSSTLLGCGKGRATIDYPAGPVEGDYWVCQYSPAGNQKHKFENNVNAPVMTAAACQAGSTAPAPTPTSTPAPTPTSTPAPTPTSTPAPTPSPTPAPTGAPSPPAPTTTSVSCENAVDGDTNDNPHIHLGDGIPVSCPELAGVCNHDFVWNKCVWTCQCAPEPPCADGEADATPTIDFGDGIPVACPELAGFCNHDFVSNKCLETCGHCN